MRSLSVDCNFIAIAFAALFARAVRCLCNPVWPGREFDRCLTWYFLDILERYNNFAQMIE